MILNTLQMIKGIGLKNSLFSIYKRIYYNGLRKKYNFDAWHASSPIESKPYKRQAVELVNEYGKSNIVEIGCGLGEILAELKSPNRVGVDYDKEVINAANHLFGKHIKFLDHDFNNIDSIDFPFREIDFLLLINWTHEMAWSTIEKKIKQLNTKYPIGRILIDTIKEGHSDYPHHHKVEDLKKLGTIVKSVDGCDGVRVIFIIELTL